MLIKTPNQENCDIKKINVHSIKEEKRHSNAEEATKLCRLHRSKGVKSDREYKAHKQDSSMKGCHYHVSTINTKIYGNMRGDVSWCVKVLL